MAGLVCEGWCIFEWPCKGHLELTKKRHRHVRIQDGIEDSDT